MPVLTGVRGNFLRRVKKAARYPAWYPVSVSVFRLSKYPAKLTYDASLVESRAVDPHSFFADADLDPGVLLNPDPVPASFLMRTRIQLNKKINKFHFEEFSGVEKDNTDY